MGEIITLRPQVKRALILRMGGLGDCLILTPIAKALHNKGYIVDYFVGSPTGDVHELIEGLPYINSVRKMIRVNGLDCIEDELKHLISVEILKRKYDEVFDFKYSVEDNRAGVNNTNGWRNTINSNYQNWVDISLSWCNIDPSKVEDNEKIPEVLLDERYSKYYEWLKEKTPIELIFSERKYRVIGVQLQASSLIRTWYKAGDLPNLLHAKYSNDVVLIFANGKWYALSKFGRQEIEFPEGYNHILCSAVLIQQMNCFISADSGSSHLAEALCIPTIGIYTTVPAWTRVKYYDFAYPIETNVECHPCFSLDAFCPLEKKKAFDSLTKEEQELIAKVESGTNIMQMSREMNTMPHGVQLEYEAAKKKVEGLSAKESACVKSITPDLILLKVDEVLGRQPVVKYLQITDSVQLQDKRI